MDAIYSKMLSKLETEIKDVRIEVDNPVRQIEIIIKLILKCLSELKTYVLEKGFASEEEEISFFKKIKPQFLSKLIFHHSVYRIKVRRPSGGKERIERYLNLELLKIERHFDDNFEFYKYYRSESTYLDHKYFLRNKHDIRLGLDSFYFETDHNFSTSHDYKVAQILSNELLRAYLGDQLKKNREKD